MRYQFRTLPVNRLGFRCAYLHLPQHLSERLPALDSDDSWPLHVETSYDTASMYYAKKDWMSPGRWVGWDDNQASRSDEEWRAEAEQMARNLLASLGVDDAQSMLTDDLFSEPSAQRVD